MKRTYYYALAGCWWGLPCGVSRHDYVPPFARWLRVSKAEYLELRADGFRVRKARRVPMVPVR